MIPVDVTKALANDKRLQILHWLKSPRAHFPRQVDGDLVRDGVCGVFIAAKLGVSQPTASEHLRILSQAGPVRARGIKRWTLYTPAHNPTPTRERAFPRASHQPCAI